MAVAVLNNCPVVGCSHAKNVEHAVCRVCFTRLPRKLQNQLYGAQREYARLRAAHDARRHDVYHEWRELAEQAIELLSQRPA